MILTCPRCTARYAVETGQVPASGRTVRCVACRHKWKAYPEDGVAETWEDAPAAAVESPSEPEPEPAQVEEPFPVVDPIIPAAPPARPRLSRFGPPALVVWAGFAALLVVLAITAALFRNQVVRLWPKTAALYAAAGMSVNGVGLVIEGVRLAPAVQNGQAVLGVSGRIRNERDHPTPAAPLQVTLYDAAGAPLSRQVARPVDVLPPLDSRYFSVLIRNPPPGVASAALAFVSQDPEAGTARGPGPAPPAAGARTTPPPPPATAGSGPAPAPAAAPAAPAAPVHD